MTVRLVKKKTTNESQSRKFQDGFFISKVSYTEHFSQFEHSYDYFSL